jgi:prepilin-type processing-associated H-X9-DG protein/prepilin-type N-terminal cleavage/methylation domain-containing protein
MNPTRNRHGYSLVEFLVCIAILGIIFALLLQAVQSMRAVALRMRCQNNLRQLALAAHSYHDLVGEFPASISSGRSTDFPYMTWQSRLLPHYDLPVNWSEAVTDYRINRDPFSEPNAHRNRDRVVELLICPSDARQRSAWRVPLYGNRAFATTAYLGVCGQNFTTMDGVFGFPRSSRIEHISDGTSSTLLCGERPPSTDLRFGWWYAASGTDGRGLLDVMLGVHELNHRLGSPPILGCEPGPFSFVDDRSENICSAFHFWSLHPGGANFAFADGSVKFLSYHSNGVISALSTRAGGEVVNFP